MKSLLFFALIFAGGPVFAAGTLQECRSKAEDKPKECNGEVTKAKAKSDAEAKALENSCITMAHDGLNVPECSQDFSRVNDSAKAAWNEAYGRCEEMAKQCDDKCTPDASVKKEDKPKMAKLKKDCRQKIESTKSSLKNGGQGNKTGSEGGKDTASESKGSGAPAAAPPPSPQQSKDDEEKTDATQPQSTPQQTAATPKEEKKDENKDGKSGFGDDTKTQSADNTCSGGKFMCPGCPGFLQKCPNGNATECISKMSASDQKIIGSNCGNTTGSSTTTQALTNPATPQSLMGGGAGGSGGGTSGTVSGGMDTQSMLDDGKKNDTQSHEGRKEGGSLGTESGGGGGGGSSDSFGSSGDLFGDSGNAASGLNMGKAVPRSLANAFQASQDSRVVDRFGPNLFSILGETIKGRCDRNLLLHCPNRK